MTPPEPSESTNEPTDDAPQRRKERGAAAGGSVDASDSAGRGIRHREEVAGQGSGSAFQKHRAGGSPATAGGDNTPATPSASTDPALDFDPAELGGVLSSTPPSNPKSIPSDASKPSPSSEITTGGEDWFEVSLYLKHHRFEKLTRLLETAKEAAEANRSPADEVHLGKLRAVSLRKSAYLGDRITYRWQLQTAGGWLIQLMNRAEPHATLPNGMVRFTSMPLLRFGTRACWAKLLEWMDALDIEVVRACPSRIDLCVDLPGVDFQLYNEPYQNGHYVARAQLSKDHGVEIDFVEHGYGREKTSFHVGANRKKVRVYDKLRETRHQPEKRALMIARRWEEEPDAATRVEFQLRREALKELGVDTVEDYFEKRAAIAWKLCTDWFRLTDGPVDRKHPERSQVLPLWWEVARAFADWAGDSIEVDLSPLPKGAVDLSHLKKQLYGLAQSVLVRSERRVLSPEDFAHEGMDLLLSLAEDRDVAAEFRRKALLLGLLTEDQP